ncbi:MAG: leucine-rich repeat domain-containing protein [Myxococcota bacterium]
MKLFILLFLCTLSIDAAAQQVLLKRGHEALTLPGRRKLPRLVKPETAPAYEYVPVSLLAEDNTKSKVKNFDLREFDRLEQAINAGEYLSIQERWRHLGLLVQYERLEKQFDPSSLEYSTGRVKTFPQKVPGIRSFGCCISTPAAEVSQDRFENLDAAQGGDDGIPERKWRIAMAVAHGILDLSDVKGGHILIQEFIAKIDEDIREGIEVLQLSGCDLTELPDVSPLSNLKRINLSNNNIATRPVHGLPIRVDVVGADHLRATLAHLENIENIYLAPIGTLPHRVDVGQADIFMLQGDAIDILFKINKLFRLAQSGLPVVVFSDNAPNLLFIVGVFLMDQKKYSAQQATDALVSKVETRDSDRETLLDCLQRWSRKKAAAPPH